MNFLRTRIDNVNNQDREELKDLYKTTITNGEFTAQGGAGLGFIEMAKTAGNKLEYTFEGLSKEVILSIPSGCSVNSRIGCSNSCRFSSFPNTFTSQADKLL